jgi:hypothetical protein
MRWPRRAGVVALLVVAGLAGGSAARAQNFAPPPPPSPPAGPTANICNTHWGWCPLAAVAMPGTPCQCFVPPATALPGVANYWPYQGPVSPYLNPHVGPPSTIR